MKEYNQVGIFRDENGNALVIPGDHETGDRIEYGPEDEPIRAKCVDLVDLPTVMRRDQVDGWVKKHMNDEDSVLKQKLVSAEKDTGDQDR